MDLGKARELYRAWGYTDVSVPTLVPHHVLAATCPFELPFFEGLKHVASGEQGFLQILLREGQLIGDFQTITACHRPQDADKGILYQEWFIKLELYSDNPLAWRDMLQEARRVYADYFDCHTHGIKTEEVLGAKNGEVDLVFNGVEIGSYGCRRYKGHTWSYGTGFVPYRLEMAKKWY